MALAANQQLAISRLCTGVIILSFLATPFAHADDLDAQAKALIVIRETAADICNTVAQEGSSQETELSGDVKAKLGGVVAKIANLGFEGAGKYTSTEYKGVLQQQLTTALQNNADCKLNVFKLLQEKMIGPINKRSEQAVPRTNISGVWNGTILYPDGRAPKPFTFTFDADNSCRGRGEEPNTFGTRCSLELFSNLSCSALALYAGRVITINKTYDGTCGATHSVIYTGTVSADLNEISGIWSLGDISGRFSLRR